MYWYYLVLKKVVHDLEPTIEYYNEVITFILGYYTIGPHYKTYEYDSKNILHCNCVFKVNKSVDFSFLKVKGCHIDIQKINNKDDMFRIMKYIHKDYRLEMFLHQLL